MNTENDELNLILEQPDKSCTFTPTDHRLSQCSAKENTDEQETSKFNTSAVQWATSNDVIFIPTGTTTPILLPGYYEIGVMSSIGVYFERIQVKTDGLLEFPEANTTKVVDEIKKFWESEHKFRGRGLTYKRGIILWGPPGGGKCFQKDTPVLMYDGTIKMVQDIKKNDLVMGDDSLPRRVLSLSSGNEMLYRVNPI